MNAGKEKFDRATRKQFSFWAKWYDSKFIRLLYFERLYGKIIGVITAEKECFKTGSKFLDVACGTGEIIYRLAGKYPGIDFTGVDFTQEMVETAKRKTEHLKNIRIINSDASELPFEDKTFDFVLCSDALHHFSEPELSIKEIGRVVKDGGCFLLVDPAANTGFQKIMVNLIGRILELANKYYSQEEMKKLLGNSGFTVERNFVYTGNNFVISKKQ